MFATLLNCIGRRPSTAWIKAAEIPALPINEQYRFHRAELLEWATARRIGVSADIFQEEGEGPLPSLGDALLAAHRLQTGRHGREVGPPRRRGGDAASGEVNREQLLTGSPGSRRRWPPRRSATDVAIPHVRNPIVLHVSIRPLPLCFLERPVDFGALDGKPVHCAVHDNQPHSTRPPDSTVRLAFRHARSGLQDAVRRASPSRRESWRVTAGVEAGLTPVPPVRAAASRRAWHFLLA